MPNVKTETHTLAVNSLEQKVFTFFLQLFQRSNPNTIYHQLRGAGPGVCSFVYNSSAAAGCNKTIRAMVAETGC